MTEKTYPKPIPTMSMVACLAGVSRNYASYYFSPKEGSPNRVSAKIGARLADAAAILGYKPFGNDAWFEKIGKYAPGASRHRNVDA